jgi:hypothetical protein
MAEAGARTIRSHCKLIRHPTCDEARTICCHQPPCSRARAGPPRTIREKNNQQRDADNGWTVAGVTAHWTECNRERAFDQAMRRVLFKAKKLKATTAAGIYGKALIVRSSRSGAMLLAMSLAEDMIAWPGLRESLWPAGEGG